MRISLIVPIYNEENTLRRSHHHFRGLNHRAELIFVDGGSSDDTVRYASQLGTVITARKGRAAQMNAGACVAHGDILLFLHADCYLSEDALSSMRQCIKQGAVGGCFTQRLANDSPVFRKIEHEGNHRARMRKIFFGDQGIFVRRDIFQRIGGFPEVPVMEDVLFSKELARMGKTVCLSEPIYASTRRWDEYGFHKTNARYKLMWLLYHLRVPVSIIQHFHMDGQ